MVWLNFVNERETFKKLDSKSWIRLQESLISKTKYWKLKKDNRRNEIRTFKGTKFIEKITDFIKEC